jgi:hypothetical protein
MVTEGIEFINADPDVVIDHIKSVKTERLEVSPSDLKIFLDGKSLMLQVMGKDKKYLPVRKSFFVKLLSWYSFPMSQTRRLSSETMTEVLNDYLLNISSDKVIIKAEDNEAKTIVSTNYSELPDLKVIESCQTIGIDKISRNDFLMRLTSRERFKVEPIPGDECGVGVCVYNSETGLRSLEMNNYIIRYVCTNGAVITNNENNNKFYHYRQNEGALENKLNEFVQKTDSLKENIYTRLEGLTHKNSENVLGDFKLKLKSVVGNKQSANILRDVSGGTSQYDLFNVLTESAKEYDLGRRNRIELLAGNLINSN